MYENKQKIPPLDEESRTPITLLSANLVVITENRSEFSHPYGKKLVS